MSSGKAWSFDLSERIVHVWTVMVREPAGSPADSIRRFEACLSPDEKDRAARFSFDHLRRSFIATRGALRMLLGRYLAIPAESVSFHYGAKGKPSIAGDTQVDFNVSHSGELALFAFTLNGKIGIDVEQIRPLPDLRQIANRFFCSEESEELLSLPAEERERAFFLCWTRKEAFIKATGEGLSTPLAGFRVSLDPRAPARMLHIGGDAKAGQAWSVHDLHTAEGYAAAIAYRCEARELREMPLVQSARLLELG